jgi:hypothetical protein
MANKDSVCEIKEINPDLSKGAKAYIELLEYLNDKFEKYRTEVLGVPQDRSGNIQNTSHGKQSNH